MAEAHAAVAFSFSVTHEGVRVNYDREVLHLIWISGVRAWKRRLNRLIVSALFDFNLKFIFASVIIAHIRFTVVACHVTCFKHRCNGYRMYCFYELLSLLETTPELRRLFH